MNEEASASAKIEEDLADTRERLDQRLGALQQKLSPRQLINDGLAYVQGGDGADFARDLAVRVQRNPIPALMVAGGLAWLFAAKSQSGDDGRSSTQADLRRVEQRLPRYADEDDETFGGRLANARGQVLGLARDAGESATDYARRIGDAVSELAHAGSTGPRDKLRASGRFLTSPIGLGVAAAAVGIIAGSVIPSTEYERQRLGSSASKLRTAGVDLAQDVADRGSRVVTEVADAVREGINDRGLTPDKPIGETVADLANGDLVRDAKAVAGDTIDRGKAAVHDELQPNGGRE
jgi:hypothetical protein